jgi:hypothetical protein
MALYLVLTLAEGQFPAALYPYVYGAKALLVTVALLVTGRTWRREIHFDGKALLLGVIAGLLGLGLWLGLDAVTPPLKFLGTRTAYNPYQEIADPALRAAFLAVRFYGLALMVPVMEEVFWRSFLLRFVTDQDRWETLPLGAFSATAFVVVALLFGFAHPEYLAAFAYAALMAGLLRQTRSLFACIVAHAVTNLALGVYVLTTGNWKLW